MSAPNIFRHPGSDEAPPQRDPTGYATLPRTIIKRDDFQVAKIVLAALFGYCWGEKRQCNPSIPMIAAACGMGRRTVQTHLNTLVKAGLISRRPDPDNPGYRWITYIHTDPRGFELDNEPRANWRVVNECERRRYQRTSIHAERFTLVRTSPPTPPKWG